MMRAPCSDGGPCCYSSASVPDRKRGSGCRPGQYSETRALQVTTALPLRGNRKIRPMPDPQNEEASPPHRSNARGDPYAFPYTDTTAPRVTRLSGDAKNRTAAATSSTFGQAA
jgi:hypothetical protein